MQYGERGEKYQVMEKTLGIWCGARNIAVLCKYGILEYENNFKEQSFKFI